MPNRKETAKRRKEQAEDSAGSALHVENDGELFDRVNRLPSVGPTDIMPLLIEDVAPADFYFPISGTQILAKLNTFNLHDKGITHVWLRGIRPTDCDAGDSRLAEYDCSDNTCALILYPWASDGVLPLSKGKPSDKQMQRFAPWSQELTWDGNSWGLQFTREESRRFLIEYLLLEQLRHHLTDFTSQRRGPTSLVERVEASYAIIWSACGIRVVD